MKLVHTPLIAFLTLLPSLYLSAQVSTNDEPMSQGIQPAYLVEIEVGNSRLVENEWKDFMDSYGGKTKSVKGNRSEKITTSADIVSVSAGKPLEVYAQTEKSQGNTTLHKVWFSIDGNYLDRNTNSDANKEAVKILEKFALQCKVTDTEQELKQAEKKLRQVESDLDKLKKQNVGYHRDIENYEKKIEKAKDDIKKNEQQQLDTAELIKLQNEMLKEIGQRLKDLRNS